MGASKLKHTEFRNSLIMQIYANLFKKKSYFSSILQQILILFVLSDSACYAKLFKISENVAFPLFRSGS